MLLGDNFRKGTVLIAVVTCLGTVGRVSLEEPCRMRGGASTTLPSKRTHRKCRRHRFQLTSAGAFTRRKPPLTCTKGCNTKYCRSSKHHRAWSQTEAMQRSHEASDAYRVPQSSSREPLRKEGHATTRMLWPRAKAFVPQWHGRELDYAAESQPTPESVQPQVRARPAPPGNTRPAAQLGGLRVLLALTGPCRYTMRTPMQTHQTAPPLQRA